MGDEGQCSERVINKHALEVALRSAGAHAPPMRLDLMASARVACRRGDRRRAIVDIGTATESALTAILGLQTTHRKTLGTLVGMAMTRGLPIPADAQSKLVAARNTAVHRGIAPSHGMTVRAMEIAEALVAQVEPDVIPVDSLRAVRRPQRHDILIIPGPGKDEDSLEASAKQGADEFPPQE